MADLRIDEASEAALKARLVSPEGKAAVDELARRRGAGRRSRPPRSNPKADALTLAERRSGEFWRVLGVDAG